MALDFHRLDTGEYLFKIDDEQFSFLSPVFVNFHQWTPDVKLIPIKMYN